MKIAVNKCHGGYSLSQKALARLIELGIPRVKYEQEVRGPNGLFVKVPSNEGVVIFDDSLLDEPTDISISRCSIGWGPLWETWVKGSEYRNHPLVIQVIEELGKEANGRFANIEIVEVPDDVKWEIDEHGGMEHVAEQHRTW